MKNKIIILLISILIVAEIYLISSSFKLGPTGFVVYSTNGSNEIIFDNNNSYFNVNSSYFGFSAKFSDDIIKHDSWHIGGFSNSNIFGDSDKAVFYVDVGVITPYLQIDKTKYWCKSLLKDWTEYHSFNIIIDNKTSFYIDNEKICEFDKFPALPLPAFLNENDKTGNLEMYVMDLKF